MPKPYVYKCINRETGEFYIGYRSQNRVPAEDDLGTYYFTSSAVVTPIFDQFDYEILETFDDGASAYAFEQDLIRSHWGDPRLLNRAVFPNFIGNRNTEEQRRKTLERMLNNNPSKKPENREKARQRQLGKKASAETRQKMSNTRKGKPIPNGGKANQKGAANNSAKTFVFRTPEGIEVTVIAGLYKFCKDNNLHYNGMIDLGMGRISNYKGWTLVSKTYSKTREISP